GLNHYSTTGRSIVLRYETSLATIVPDILGPAGPPVSPATRPIQFSGAPIYSNSAPWMPDSRCTWSRVRRPPYHVKQSDVIDCPRMRWFFETESRGGEGFVSSSWPSM